MKTPLILTLLLAVALVSPAHARTLAEAKAAGTLNLYTSTDFAPFSSLIGSIASGGQKPVGFEVDLGNLIASRLGLKPVWHVKGFDALLPLVRTDRSVDLVIASHAITSTRARLVSFTNPHYCTGGVVLTRSGGPLTNQAFGGKRVGAEDGSTYAGYLKKLPTGVQVNVFANSEQSYAALLAGGVDAVVTDRFAALAAVDKYPQGKLMVGKTLWQERIGMVVARDNTALKAAVNQVLAKLLEDGSYARLSQEYFKQDVRC